MFFSKKPSATNNNKLRDNACRELQTAIFKLKNGEHNAAFSESKIQEWIKKLEALQITLSNSICTGNEDVHIIAETITEDIRNITKTAFTSLSTKVEREIDTLQKHIMTWKDVNNGIIFAKDVIDKLQKENVDRSTRQVLEQLDEFQKCKDMFDAEFRRLSQAKINNLNDLKEYEDQMAEATDNDAINTLDAAMTELETENVILDGTIEQLTNVSSMLNTIKTYVETRVKLNRYSEEGKQELLTYLDTGKINIDDPGYTAGLVSHIYENIQKIRENSVVPTPPPKPVRKPVNPVAPQGTTLTSSAEARKKAIMEKKEARRLAQENKELLNEEVEAQKTDVKEEIK